MAQSPAKLSAAQRRQNVARGASPWKKAAAGRRAPKGRQEHSNDTRLPFALTLTASTGSTYAPFVRRHLRAARRLLDSPLSNLHVVLANDKSMSRLHDQFMGIKGPTDVLTFPLDLDPKGRPLSGEVYINVDHARRESKLRHIPLQNELLLYALHGMLHLSGYDDRTDRDFAKMHEKEDDILRQLGIGPVFTPEPRDARDAGGRK